MTKYAIYQEGEICKVCDSAEQVEAYFNDAWIDMRYVTIITAR